MRSMSPAQCFHPTDERTVAKTGGCCSYSPRMSKGTIQFKELPMVVNSRTMSYQAVSGPAVMLALFSSEKPALCLVHIRVHYSSMESVQLEAENRTQDTLKAFPGKELSIDIPPPSLQAPQPGSVASHHY